ncbi:hypothetical protein PAEVO_60950 [Paenibacillus sp. GM2FR]|uniref:hypothetical protein n=1 Tax=unclassified Paenibacillus TaxID=185978 RepID=UPI000C26E072|nr:hypothetical protein [Paenibacillus sp. GM2FR]PJN49386.1 hypothetical protein PAEVO_60950 [Paenibacillus sp. GM2FR]
MAKSKEVIDSAAKRWMLTFPLWIIVTISLLCIFWIFGLLIDLGLPRQNAGWINIAIVGTYLIGYLAGELYVDLDRTDVVGEQAYTPGDDIKSGSLKKRILHPSGYPHGMPITCICPSCSCIGLAMVAVLSELIS